MVIDSSALLAILLQEPDHPAYAAAIESAPVRLISAVTALEAALVIESRKRDAGGRELDLLIQKAKLTVVPFDAEQSDAARIAWRKYGKGRHAAGLNFCDCCAYAVSVTTGEPLLFKGRDFTQTDVEQAPLPLSGRSS